MKAISSLLNRLAEAQAPRIVLSIRPQDPLPEWITHIVRLGPELRVALQGRKDQVLRGLSSSSAAGKVVEADDHNAGKSLLASREGLSFCDGGSKVEGEPIVEMHDICVRYGDKVVLGNWQEFIKGQKRQGLNWTVRRGQRWVICGLNGNSLADCEVRTMQCEALTSSRFRENHPSLSYMLRSPTIIFPPNTPLLPSPPPSTRHPRHLHLRPPIPYRSFQPRNPQLLPQTPLFTPLYRIRLVRYISLPSISNVRT